MASAGFVASSPRADFHPGSTVGRFRIIEQLGKGATGEVYRAEDTKLKRAVALKRLAADLHFDPDCRRRFQQEAEQVSRFCDPHVANLYDVLEENDEMLLVMEYVQGQTLRQRLRSPLTLEQFLHIALQCAVGLAAAHDLGIIHCDVKPENVMLTARDEVKILDFGLAKRLPRSDQSSTLESSTALAGTPAYMSPEVLLQKVPDGRSDVFSLGVMFYEMLTGQHPFAADSFLATADRIRKETPAPIHIFNPAASPELEAVVAKAMAKDPGQRYANARELLDDLRRVTGGRIATARSLPWSALRLRGRSAPSAVSAVVVLIAVLASVAAYRYAHPPRVLSQGGWVLISDFATAGDDAIPEAALREGLSIALQQSRYVNVFPRMRVYEVLQRMQKPEVTRIDEAVGREICRRENLQVLISGSIDHAGNAFQITVRALDPAQGTLLFAEQERFERRDQFFEKADAVARRLRKDLGESLGGIETNSRPLAKVSTVSIEALQLYSQGLDAMARGNLDQVPPVLQEALKFDPNFAMAHMLLGSCYSWLVGRNGRALAEFERAYELRSGVTDRERRRIEAFYYSALERYDDAAQSLSVLVSLYPGDAEAHEELASAYYNVGQLDRAIAELRQVLRLDPSSPLAYRSLVLYLARKGAYAEALAAFHEAELRGIQTSELNWGLGLVFLGQGDVPRAREAFMRLGGDSAADRDLQQLYLTVADLHEGKLEAAAASLRRTLASRNSPGEGMQLFRRYLLGRIFLEQRRNVEAARQATLLLRTSDANLQTNDLLEAGILYARAGDLAKARAVLARLDQSAPAPNSWTECSVHNLRGEIYLAESKLGDAEDAFMAADRASPQVFSEIGLARTYQAQQRWALAAAAWERVLAAQGEILQNDFPPDLSFAHYQLAQIYQRMGRTDSAIAHCRQILNSQTQSDDGWLLRDTQRLWTQLTGNHSTPTSTNSQ